MPKKAGLTIFLKAPTDQKIKKTTGCQKWKIYEIWWILKCAPSKLALSSEIHLQSPYI
jgi:hypothetical protein